MKEYVFQLMEETIRCNRSKTVGYNHAIMHMHNLYEIMFIMSEHGSCFINDKIYEVGKCNVFLFGDTDLHKMSVPEGVEYERYLVFFSPNILASIFKHEVDLLKGYELAKKYGNNQIILTQDQGEELLLLLKKLEVSSNADHLPSMESILLLAQILCYINDNIVKESNEEHFLKKQQHKQIAEIIAYVNDYYTENISLDSIANNFFINKSYLCRLFKKETGFQLSKYITYRRMTHAIQLLRKGLSVVEVSDLCGFHSDTYFITIFKKNFGITPKKYMQMMSREKN